jgi:hypothetical protein
LYFDEWLCGLQENIKDIMRSKGFEGCKTILPFTRYVNERNDVGMDEWMKENLSDEDYKAYKAQGKD